MGDDVIVNYIRSSGKAYRLNADDIIYLNSQGVSQGVIGCAANHIASPAQILLRLFRCRWLRRPDRRPPSKS